MDEKILVVNRDMLFDNEFLEFEGLLTEARAVGDVMENFEYNREARRGDVENDPYVKQPIPYGIIKRGDTVLVYERLKGGGEKRLHNTLSIGVGGHMNAVGRTHSWNSTIMINLLREVHEELNISKGFEEIKTVGLINTDNDGGVGLYHIGILVILELDEDADVEINETDSMCGAWVKIEDLVKSPCYDNLEEWSRLAATYLQEEVK